MEWLQKYGSECIMCEHGSNIFNFTELLLDFSGNHCWGILLLFTLLMGE